MTAVVALILLILVLLLVAAGWVVFALLKRLDEANQALKTAADSTMKQAFDTMKQAPKQFDAMTEALSGAISKIHATIDSTVKTVFAPAVMPQGNDGTLPPYVMPTMNEGQEPAPWDHTDRMFPDPPNPNPTAVMGYEHELSPDFDPENPFGIPGMKSLVP